jgi:hypothetical protein
MPQWGVRDAMTTDVIAAPDDASTAHIVAVLTDRGVVIRSNLSKLHAWPDAVIRAEVLHQFLRRTLTDRARGCRYHCRRHGAGRAHHDQIGGTAMSRPPAEPPREPAPSHRQRARPGMIVDLSDRRRACCAVSDER